MLHGMTAYMQTTEDPASYTLALFPNSKLLILQMKHFPCLSSSICHCVCLQECELLVLTYSYPFISQLRECIHNDTKHDIQTNGGHNDKES